MFENLECLGNKKGFLRQLFYSILGTKENHGGLFGNPWGNFGAIEGSLVATFNEPCGGLWRGVWDPFNALNKIYVLIVFKLSYKDCFGDLLKSFYFRIILIILQTQIQW